MRFKYKKKISEQILEEKTKAIMEGRAIEEIFLSKDEMDMLKSEFSEDLRIRPFTAEINYKIYGIKLSLEE
jgi:hypothetical protein